MRKIFTYLLGTASFLSFLVSIWLVLELVKIFPHSRATEDWAGVGLTLLFLGVFLLPLVFSFMLGMLLTQKDFLNRAISYLSPYRKKVAVLLWIFGGTSVFLGVLGVTKVLSFGICRCFLIGIAKCAFLSSFTYLRWIIGYY